MSDLTTITVAVDGPAFALLVESGRFDRTDFADHAVHGVTFHAVAIDQRTGTRLLDTLRGLPEHRQLYDSIHAAMTRNGIPPLEAR